jgi:hypothetical protein
MTAANYLGSGNWTVSPFVTSITIGGVVAVPVCVYVPSLLEIWVFRRNEVQRINANPNSVGFNTTITTFAVPFGDAISSYYNSYDDTVVVLSSNLSRVVNCKTFAISTIPLYDGWTIGPLARAQYCGMSHSANNILLSGGQGTLGFFYNAKNIPNKTIATIWVSIVNAICDQWIIERSGAFNRFVVYNMNGDIVASLNLASQTNSSGQNPRVAYFKSLQKLYIQNVNSILAISTFPTFAQVANIAKGYVAGGENQTGLMLQCNSDKVLIACGAFSVSSIAPLHVIDPVTDTYVGYINTVGQQTVGPNLSFNFWACKNQLEI